MKRNQGDNAEGPASKGRTVKPRRLGSVRPRRRKGPDGEYHEVEGCWVIRWSVGQKPDGSPIHRVRSFRGTRKQAETQLSHEIARRDTGTDIPPDRVTVGEWLTQWLEDWARPRVSARTLLYYRQTIERHLGPHLGHLKLQQLTAVHIQRYYTAVQSGGRLNGAGGLSAKSVREHHGILRQALKQAHRLRMIKENPVEQVTPPRAARSRHYALNVQEVALLLEALRGTRFYLPVLLAVATGMRQGEILALRWRQVDLERQVIEVLDSVSYTPHQGTRVKGTKTGVGRAVKMPDYLCEALREHRREQQAAGIDSVLVLPGKDGVHPLNPSGFASNFRRLMTEVRAAHPELPAFRFHDLRHTQATLMLRAGVMMKVVQERLGHSSIQVTGDIYSHVQPGMQDEAAALMDRILRGPVDHETGG